VASSASLIALSAIAFSTAALASSAASLASLAAASSALDSWKRFPISLASALTSSDYLAACAEA